MEEFVPHFKFEKLKIWQKAMDFGEDVFDASKKFPKEELYNLTSQVRRAADSIALNIAEGSISQSYPEYKKFLGYSIRSLAEVVTCLYKALRRKYIDQEQFNELYAEAFHLMNMMHAFKSKLM
ncbi:four helix bundle protein [Algoriphagus namhaensis]